MPTDNCIGKDKIEQQPLSENKVEESLAQSASMVAPVENTDKRHCIKKRKKEGLPNNSLYYTIPDNVLIPYEKEIRDRIANNGHRGLIDNLQRLFTEEALLPVIELYRLGSIDYRRVVYPYFDIKNQLRTIKTVMYETNGCRMKNGNSISLMHRKLKEEGVLPARWAECCCVFGEHLLTQYPDRPVFIVESEKTAIACAILIPSYIWLATGGCGYFKQLGMIKEHLNSRITYILPDKGQYAFWSEEARKYGLKAKVLDYLEKMDVKSNTDVADLFFRKRRKLQISNFISYAASLGQCE